MWIHGIAVVFIYNISISIIDSNLVATIFLILHIEHIAQTELWNVGVGIDVEAFLDDVFHFISIHGLVDEAQFDELLCIGQIHETIGVCVERVGRNLTAGRYVFEHYLPYACHIGSHLFAVSFAHAVGSHLLWCALVFSYFAEFKLNAKLSEQIFVEYRFGSQSVPTNLTLWVEQNLVSHRRGSIRSGCIRRSN